MRSSIQISTKTKEKIAKLGTISGTYESVIVEMLEHIKKCDQWWEDK